MSFIALFCPACISMLIKQKRNPAKKENVFVFILEYMSYLFINVLLTQIVVVYVLGLGEVEMSVLNRFAFFTKYSIIAFAIAFLTPYVGEIVKKYIKVSFSIQEKAETKEKS